VYFFYRDPALSTSYFSHKVIYITGYPEFFTQKLSYFLLKKKTSSLIIILFSVQNHI